MNKHSDLKSLLKELDYFSNMDDKDNVNEINKKIKDYAKKHTNHLQTPSFNAYPEYKDPDFTSKIYNKKEFNNTIASKNNVNRSFDELAAEKCSQTRFKLTNNQLFLKNFLSPQTPYNGLLLFHGVGVGKCFRLNTPILMFSGNTKQVQNIEVGDIVMGDDSGPRNVLALSPANYDILYEVHNLSSGGSYAVNSNHILTLYNMYEKRDIDITILDFLALPKEQQNIFYGRKSDIIFFQNYGFHTTRTDIAYKMGQKKYSDCSYKLGNILVRSWYLAGFIDEWGIIEEDHIVFNVKDCSNDILFVARSLSIGVDITDKTKVKMYGEMLNNLPIQNKCVSPNIPAKYYKIEIKKCKEKEIYFGFEVDCNHRFLLGDFTVTHNSCSAISIAEQYSSIFEKKILVLMPPNLKDNFKKQIFDIGKGISQCTGTKYQNIIGEEHNLLSQELIDKRVNRIINDSYQLFGFLEFANSLKNIRDTLNNEAQFNAHIKREFSNRVIIIDEVHNVREVEEDLDKIVTPLLLKVLQNAENTKLIMLSATPMFNEASEIVWLINMLLANDKKPLLQAVDIFSGKNGEIDDRGMHILSNAIKGYVSYMQGENPFSFPFRLYPSINNDPNLMRSKDIPKFDIKGKPIPKDEMLSKLELITSPMAEKQRARMKMEYVDQSKNTQLIQISNVIFPNNTYGADGLKETFDRNDQKQYVYKTKMPQLFSQNVIQNYAPKIKTICDYIKNSTGIVFVYSFFIDSGIIPTAMALEHIGFKRYNGPNLLTGLNPPPKPFLLSNGKQATYTILSARKDLTPDKAFIHDINVSKLQENANGELIKVILGTSVSSEGIDFKCIREMHMLDPWYHLNKPEQIFGRGIRHCSHVNLPPSERNVTLYYHVCKDTSSSWESIDERIYRIAENKQIQIDKIEKLLKKMAIDCHINKNAFEATNKKINIVTSQGKDIKDFQIQPKHKYIGQCAEEIKEDQEIDSTTFHKQFYTSDIEDIVELVARLYRDTHYATYEDIARQIKVKDEEILIYTLDYMLDTKYKIFHGQKETPGYLIYRSNIYLFQPQSSSDLTMSLEARRNYTSPAVNILEIGEETSDIIDVENTTDFEEQLKKEVAEFKSKYEKEKIIFQKQVYYDFIIDRMDFQSILNLIKNTTNMNIRKSLITANIYIENLNWVRNIYKEPVEYIKVDTLEEVSTREKEMKEKDISFMLKRSRDDIKGYIDQKKKFKVLDADTSLTSKGFVCYQTAQLKVDKLRDMIGIPNIPEGEKKTSLCELYELKLRDTNEFARAYEARLLLNLKIVS